MLPIEEEGESSKDSGESPSAEDKPSSTSITTSPTSMLASWNVQPAAAAEDTKSKPPRLSLLPQTEAGTLKPSQN
jgi:hypothetical protein